MSEELKKPATVFFVGSGPGDPELITVKGMRLLKDADLVGYAGSRVREGGPDVYNSASMSLPEIVAVMIEGAKAGKKVVRLHTGDPSLYGALREQAEALDK